MPKLTRSRRRRRDLFATTVELASASLGAATLCSLAHRTTPRKVSEDDIQSSSHESNSSSEQEEHVSLRVDETGQRKRLKRPTPSACLVELSKGVGACHDRLVLSTPISQRSCHNLHSLSHSVSVSSEEDTEVCSSGSSSPWGHFVDLLQPSSSASDCDEERPNCQSFLPFVQSADPPYPLKRARHRITSPSKNVPSLTDGFVLTLPGSDNATSDTFGQLMAAERALRGLHMDE